MGDGRYRPTFWEAVVTQILCFVLLIFLPIVWVVLILFGMVKILRNPSEAILVAKDTAEMIGVATIAPFAVTVEHCRLLRGRSNDYEYVCANL